MFPHYTMYLLAVVTFIMVAYSSILDFRVEPGTSCYKEPKFIVFFTKLLCLFSLFCFKCKRDQPNVTMKQRGTMVIVNQQCMICGDNSFSWKSQPMMFNGRYPAGNVLLSFSILMAGASISKILLVFKHMGLSAYNARTFFFPSKEFSVPCCPQLLGALSSSPHRENQEHQGCCVEWGWAV